MKSVKLLDVVAPLNDRSDLGLVRGEFGTLVEQLEPDAWEVEFADENGQTQVFAALTAREFLVVWSAPAAG